MKVTITREALEKALKDCPIERMFVAGELGPQYRFDLPPSIEVKVEGGEFDERDIIYGHSMKDVREMMRRYLESRYNEAVDTPPTSKPCYVCEGTTPSIGEGLIVCEKHMSEPTDEVPPKMDEIPELHWEKWEQSEMTPPYRKELVKPVNELIRRENTRNGY